jgi:hypothetical protein
MFPDAAKTLAAIVPRAQMHLRRGFPALPV